MAFRFHALLGLWAVLMLAAIMQASAGRSMLQSMHWDTCLTCLTDLL